MLKYSPPAGNPCKVCKPFANNHCCLLTKYLHSVMHDDRSTFLAIIDSQCVEPRNISHYSRIMIVFKLYFTCIKPSKHIVRVKIQSSIVS